VSRRQRVLEWVVAEWLVIGAAVVLLGLSLYTGQLPVYTRAQWQVLFFLFVLLLSVSGLERSGVLSALSRRLEHGRAVALKLVLLSFFLSMVVTNDVALIVVVPVTLLLRSSRLDLLVILETLAANAGSALTPFGNPQNLFIYWYYHLPGWEFVRVIAPFTLAGFVALLAASLLIKDLPREPQVGVPVRDRRKARVYVLLLVLVLLSILRVLPGWTGVVVVIYALWFDRGSLKLDYLLLLTFVFFFGIADLAGHLLHPARMTADTVFIYTALLSQLISNVPATLLLAGFTPEWQALLWGASVGGFGSLLGSLANLIAYRLYLRHSRHSIRGYFTVKFLLLGYVAFFIGIILYYFAMHRMHGLRALAW